MSLTNYSWRDVLRDRLKQVAQVADDAGLDTLWVADHLIQADPYAAPEDTEHLEAYTTPTNSPNSITTRPHPPILIG